MAHVQITLMPTGKPGSRLIVDGVDLTDAVLAEGFNIISPNETFGRPVVEIRLMVDRLNVEIPDGIVKATDGDPLPIRRLCDKGN